MMTSSRATMIPPNERFSKLLPFLAFCPFLSFYMNKQIIALVFFLVVVCMNEAPVGEIDNQL